MVKVDYKKTLKELYSPPSKTVVRVDVPPLRYLMIDGQGDPNTSPDYQRAVECLYSVAYTIKFAVKRGPKGTDFGVMPLERLWWADDMATFSVERKSDWKWTMMIMQPDVVDRGAVEAAIGEVRRKKQLAELELLRFETLNEVCARRRCTSGRSPRRARRSPACMTSSPRAAASGASTTRSTCPISARPTQADGRR